MDDNDFELTNTTVSADTKWDLRGNKEKIMKMLFKTHSCNQVALKKQIVNAKSSVKTMNILYFHTVISQ